MTSFITELVHFFVKGPAEAHSWVRDFHAVLRPIGGLRLYV